MGSALKLVNNLIMVQGLVAFCEGLVLGQALGLPRTLIFDALVGQAVVPGHIGGKRAKLENQEYSPEFRCAGRRRTCTWPPRPPSRPVWRCLRPTSPRRSSAWPTAPGWARRT